MKDVVRLVETFVLVLFDPNKDVSILLLWQCNVFVQFFYQYIEYVYTLVNCSHILGTGSRDSLLYCPLKVSYCL